MQRLARCNCHVAHVARISTHLRRAYRCRLYASHRLAVFCWRACAAMPPALPAMSAAEAAVGTAAADPAAVAIAVATEAAPCLAGAAGHGVRGGGRQQGRQALEAKAASQPPQSSPAILQSARGAATYHVALPVASTAAVAWTAV
jgi:hypothetical protein